MVPAGEEKDKWYWLGEGEDNLTTTAVNCLFPTSSVN